jgi:nucleotide-binding universal stress UspA family protein
VPSQSATLEMTEEAVSAVKQPKDASGTIVVGVDGSDSSKAALRWAVREAELTGSPVEAVIAWQYPPMIGGFGLGPASAMALNFDEIAAKTLADSVAEVIDPAAPVRIATAVTQGHPAQVLLRAADGADLLVVGSRGHGGFTGALLGSVSQYCALHAPCPLIIVRAHAGSRAA